MTGKQHLQLHKSQLAFASLSAVAFMVIAVALNRLQSADALIFDELDELHRAHPAMRGRAHPYSNNLDRTRAHPTRPDQPPYLPTVPD